MEENLTEIEIEGQHRPATLNLTHGKKVYGERLVTVNGKEYRVWDPFRSKLAACLLKGIHELPFRKGSSVLYLGASTGTTISHISDLIGPEGVVFGVEVSTRVAREFIERVCATRHNVVPIIEDARRPERYQSVYCKVDVVYCDIAQPDQTDIAILNCRHYLKRNGSLLLVVKARSIDVVRNPKEIFKEEEQKLHNEKFEVGHLITLEPFDKDHAMIFATMS